MASFLAKIWARLNPTRVPLTIMFVGLDNSGKTSILNTLSSSSSTCRQPQDNAKTAAQQSRSSPSSDQSDNLGADPNIDRLFRGDDNFYGIEQRGGDFLDGKYDDDFLLTDEERAGQRSRGKPNKALGGALFSGSVSSDNRSGSQSPTIGYNFERIQLKNLVLTVLDFSGQTKYRSLWQEFYNAVDGIVFVIDSSDLIRLVVARDELENLLSHPYFATLAFESQSAPAVANWNDGRQLQTVALAPKQLTISQGKLIQTPLDTVPLAPQQSAVSTTTTSCRQRQQTRPTASTSKSLKPANNTSLALFHSLSSATTTTPAAQQQPPKSAGRRRTRVPILFLANKADLANSVKTEVIAKALNLSQLSPDRHPWLIQATSATGGGAGPSQGIAEAFDWLTNQLSLATAGVSGTQ